MILFLGVILFFATAGFFLLLWRLWIVDGVLDTPIFFLLGGGTLAILGYGLRTQSMIVLWIMAFLLGGSAMFYGVIEGNVEKNSQRNRLLDEVKKLKRRLVYNPSDYIAMRELGKVYLRLEMFDLAIKNFKAAIKLDPPEVVELRVSLNRALDAKKAGKFSNIKTCPNCHEQVFPGSEVCVHCGADLKFDFYKWISDPDVYGDIVKYTVIAIALAVIGVSILSSFSLEVKAVLAMSAVIVGVFLIFRSVQNA